jgi:hypothetical protein
MASSSSNQNGGGLRMKPRQETLDELQMLASNLFYAKQMPIILSAGAWGYRGAVFNWIKHIYNLGIDNYIVLCYDQMLFDYLGPEHAILIYDVNATMSATQRAHSSREVEYMRRYRDKCLKDPSTRPVTLSSSSSLSSSLSSSTAPSFNAKKVHQTGEQQLKELQPISHTIASSSISNCSMDTVLLFNERLSLLKKISDPLKMSVLSFRIMVSIVIVLSIRECICDTISSWHRVYFYSTFILIYSFWCPDARQVCGRAQRLEGQHPGRVE